MEGKSTRVVRVPWERGPEYPDRVVHGTQTGGNLTRAIPVIIIKVAKIISTRKDIFPTHAVQCPGGTADH